MDLRTLAEKIVGEKIMGMVDYFRHPELRNSWGGPFNGQTFRQQIFRELIQKISFSVIAETGTFRDTTTEYLYESSQLPVYTAELHPGYYGYVKARFFMHKSIVV